MNCCSAIFGSIYRADQDSYLSIKHLDGRHEHLTGPIQLHSSRFKHESVRVVRHERFVATERQCVDIVHLDGRYERRAGPCSVTFDLFVHSRCEVKTPQRHVASQSQYLVVQHMNGQFVHLRGPQELCFHPLEHEKIETHESIKLAANEAIVVYRRVEGSPQEGRPTLTAKLEVLPAAGAHGKDKAGVPTGTPLLAAETAGQEGATHVERRVVHGPAVFMPDHNEWLHTFSWHGSVGKDGKGSKTGYAGDVKVPHALSFTVIRCMPDQMYLSVREVRTTDDAALTVHLMIFYEMLSIETMLDSTNDMIGDFVSSATADVMTFASQLTYESFLQQTSKLSEVRHFPILASRMEQTGNALLKVVYRGYQASSQLQEMHDQAISRRTKLRLEADAAREEQEKRSMELRCRQERSKQEHELEEKAAKHKLGVAAMQKEQERKMADEEHAQAMRYAQQEASIELERERARHDEELRRQKESAELEASRLGQVMSAEQVKWAALKDLGVDLTQYLCALAVAKPDQHFKIDTGAAPPSVHLELPPVRSRAT